MRRSSSPLPRPLAALHELPTDAARTSCAYRDEKAEQERRRALDEDDADADPAADADGDAVLDDGAPAPAAAPAPAGLALDPRAQEFVPGAPGAPGPGDADGDVPMGDLDDGAAAQLLGPPRTASSRASREEGQVTDEQGASTQEEA